MNRISAFENALGGGLVIGLFAGIFYWLLAGTKFIVAFPYILGLATAMAFLGVIKLLIRPGQNILILCSVFLSGALGGVCIFLLSNHSIHFIWYIVGGSLIFFILWRAELRNA